jgi:hypothetical protein
VNFNPERREEYWDKDGKPLKNSAGEGFTGPATEFDFSKPAVTIGMNLPDLPLSTIAQLMQCVNDSPLWGLNARCVKLSGCRARRLLYGTCSYFYSVDLDFDIDYNTFDRKIVDAGTTSTKTGGTPGVQADMIKNRTSEGDMVRYYLDGNGNVVPNAQSAAILTFQKYKTANLFLLGIPPSL